MKLHAVSRQQQGAATLIVVMVLFFVLSMVAAYTSRNIIFEQRTSSNLQAANVVQEVADAAMEWTLSMLNAGNIDAVCAANTNPGALTPSFRQRYLSTDANGMVSGSAAYPAGSTVAACGFDAATQSWNCQCPTGGAVPAVPAVSPAFALRFVVPNNQRPGTIRAEINACVQSSAECLAFRPVNNAFCQATTCSLLGLQSSLKTPPSAALTALGAVNAAPGDNITATISSGFTPDQKYGGKVFTLRAGGAINLGAMTLAGPPGVPASIVANETTLANDSTLAVPPMTPERFFAAFFGVWPTTYDAHPASVIVNCAGTCNAQTVRNAALVNPDRAIVLLGDVALDGGGDIGSPANPVVLVIQGNLSFAASTRVFGFVYARTATWNTSGAGEIIGAAAAQGAVTGTGSFSVNYDADILNLLRTRNGSMLKVPGGWQDFQPI